MPKVYINAIAKFLPNDPVPNERMEQVLGVVNGVPSRARSIVLRNNRITSRYYAIGKDGQPTHNNAELTVQAINQLMEQSGTDKREIDILSCGTSTPDQLLPSHASMVHGLWQNKPMELNSASGICTSGINALKYAYMALATGSARQAVCTGSERVSSWLRADKFINESERLAALEQNPIIAFEKDFLRWMLSDGAAAMLLTTQPLSSGTSLAIHWIEGISYAHELEPCMYAGATKVDGKLLAWSDSAPNEWLSSSIFAIKQDIKLLEAYVIPKGVQSIQEVLRRHHVDARDIDYFLPHISSYFFKDRLSEAFIKAGIDIPEEKWFINLHHIGNVGSASSYIQLEELFNRKTLQRGEKILLSVPESGRFSYVYALLEVT
ncbi:beta-ketoacyl-ACP synthase III [Parapedobacter indicus]|uniref:3-oxoacyl-[acyl-carrier-protein] synthase-3 n=1 Tax=Parapedobacter indicus TaxID=1477437 RepID=A0A1I3FHG2_9SPHI|nr:beta-ketoacyl-ACP synthase III [Parapedobacter indicus]PPL03727.1 3-oxoacyl-[acyl-carrier-protein] synthase-3 [Parapedobacter indicus]SFI10645.1 3-oxoacyl-[acyl-carrier-protein] synthase-3 [Parapedobacter indicus]